MTSLYRVDGIPVTKMVSSDERKVNRLSLCLRCKKRQNKKPLHHATACLFVCVN